ncbi:AfsR/SARP family transcriptional regulator [Kutzneria chonburiensis]|uniref:BTAD domain-containing putative transcriptional regulator n=1 Tax=Kutzneria chonburiensis TaxID=1483604 RepID=A0ABV6MVZ6_9PSEU|nr:BTAD domain-containing putative transcriptional regulator [Kutzneria chonburiensis]
MPVPETDPVPTIRVEVLGPVRAWRGDVEIELGAPRQRAVLAVLASNAGRAVSRTELIDSIWGEHPPASAEGSVHTYIAGLRRALEPDRTNRAPSQVLASAGSGYLLRLSEAQVDLTAFESHLAAMRQAGADTQTSLCHVESAIALWRGAPLSGIPGPFSEIERTRLAELYLTAVEHRAELMLRTGRATDVVAELSRVVHEHPLREKLRGLLMSGLYRCGRQAEALEVYAETRRTLANELGVQPGPALRQLHEQILANDPDLSDRTPRPAPAAVPVPSGRIVPAQLPHDINTFTGRETELALLRRHLDTTERGVLIAAIDGIAGIGKTALAVHFAHTIADRFPDGQLYVNLRGFDPSQPPLSAVDALGQLLRGLGVEPHQVPSAAEEQASMYRSLVAGKRILVVLDNAASTDQLRSLLPGSHTCMVLVTSRNRLGGLVARDGAYRITLDVLSAGESRELLVRSVGEERLTGCPDALATLTGHCGHLPLALRIIAANLAARPHMTVNDLAEALSHEQDRLDVLASPDDETTAVRAVFSWSYHALKPEAARTFRLLGLHPGPEIGTAAAAALAGAPLVATRRMLDGLSSCHLVEAIGRDRYRLHDLLRVYATERAVAEEPVEERAAATGRLMSWYLHTSAAADRMLMPQNRPIPLEPVLEHCEPLEFAAYHHALAWLEQERVNLVAACLAAGRLGDHETGWKLPTALVYFLELRSYWEDWIATQQVAVDAARALGVAEIEALALRSLGNAYWRRNRYDDALGCFQEGLGITQRLGDQQGTATLLYDIGAASRLGDESLRHLREAFRIFSELGDRRYEGMTLVKLARTHRNRGEVEQALEHLRKSLDIVHELGDRRCEAFGRLELARIHFDLGNFTETLRNARWACSVFRELGDRHGEACALQVCGTALQGLGELAPARETYLAAAAIFAQLGDPRADEIAALLAA